MNNLNEQEVENINRARKLMRNLEKQAKRDAFVDDTYSFGLGQINEASRRAAEALFNVLNLMNTTGHATLTQEQLHPHGLND
jgi:5-carboxymethyl-2-hydroxymuconate isomerase